MPPTRRIITAYVLALERPEVRLIDVPGLCTLGALRNLSLVEGRGSYFCQWDDDDRHHPQRLASQLQGLRDSGLRAACLEEVMQFFPHDRSLFCLNWRSTEAKSFPGTLFSEESVEIHYPESGRLSSLGEDLVVVRQLLKQGELHVLPGTPHLVCLCQPWPE